MGAATALALLSLPATSSPTGSAAETTVSTTDPAVATVFEAGTVLEAADRPAKAPAPRTYLDEPAHGTEAIAALGEHLGEVAAINAMPPRRLIQLLRTDSSLWIGRDGRAFYADPVAEFAEPEDDEPATRNPAMLIYPESQTFQLHSLPGSTKTIYLDFTGITLTAPNFWTDNGLSPGAYSGFSLDADPAFSSEEKAYIQTVWRIVAEKYATFDVDVTTENPGSAAYNRSTWADNNYGARVAITSAPGIAPQLCSGSCAGISLIGTFNDPLIYWGVPVDYLQPAWVFTSGLSAYVAANVATHEVGHQLGLLHDGTAGSAYYDGQGNWVPVMGRSNDKAVVQFDKGEYSGANNPQDDFAVMTSEDSYKPDGTFLFNGGGLARRSDDVGDTTMSARDLGVQTGYEEDGIIGSRSDVDVFRIARPCDGELTVAATGIGHGQTLDIKLDLLDYWGNQLFSANPAWQSNQSMTNPVGLDADLSVLDAASGVYFVRIDGTGRGSPMVDGYSDYGSVGQYHLEVSGCADIDGAAPSPPTAVVTSHDGEHGTLSWDVPADDGGAPVFAYKVTGVPGIDNPVPSSTTSVPLSGLTPGMHLDVAVQAINAYGTSTQTNAELDVGTWSPTGPPVLTPGVLGGNVSLHWEPPANPGEATFTGWEITVLDEDDEEVASATSTDGALRSWSLPDELEEGRYRAVLRADNVADQYAEVPVAEAPFSVVGPPTELTVDGFTRGAGTLSWTPPGDPEAADPEPADVTGYRVDGLPGGSVTTTDTSLPLNLHGGETGHLTVVSLTGTGESLPSEPLDIRVPTWLPTGPPTLTTTVSGKRAQLTWARPANPGNATLTGWRISLSPQTAPLGTTTLPAAVSAASFTLPPGNYSMSLVPLYSADESGSAPGTTRSLSIRTAPSAPRIKKAKSGKRGKPVNVRARWKPPADSGNSAITGYVVLAKRVGPAPKSKKGKKAKTRKILTSPLLGPGTRTFVVRLPKGKYRLRVVAYNAAGASPASAWSAKVTAR